MIDRADQVMPIALDATWPSTCRTARRRGLRVQLSSPLEAIEHDDDGHPTAVRTADGVLRADHVVVATGVKAETGIAAAAGLQVGDHGGLRTDDHQRCPGFDGVFAAGDCVETWHRCSSATSTCSSAPTPTSGPHRRRQRDRAGTPRSPACSATAVSRICSREVARTGLTMDEVTGLTDIDAVSAVIESTTRAGYFPASARCGSSSSASAARAGCSAARSSARRARQARRRRRDRDLCRHDRRGVRAARPRLRAAGLAGLRPAARRGDPRSSRPAAPPADPRPRQPADRAAERRVVHLSGG
jgi:hypothetical protein